MNPDQETVISYDEDGQPPTRLEMDTELQQAMSMARRINQKIGEDTEDFIDEAPQVPPVVHRKKESNFCLAYLKHLWTKFSLKTSACLDLKKIVTLFVVLFMTLLLPSISLGEHMNWFTVAMGQADQWPRALVRVVIAVVAYTFLCLYV